MKLSSSRHDFFIAYFDQVLGSKNNLPSRPVSVTEMIYSKTVDFVKASSFWSPSLLWCSSLEFFFSREIIRDEHKNVYLDSLSQHYNICKNES